MGTVEIHASDEWSDRLGINAAITKAVKQRDFEALDKMETEFREKRLRTSSGLWWLSQFYDNLKLSFAAKDVGGGCSQGLLNFAQDWANAKPDTPGPVIAVATGMIDYGACVRGTETADKTPEKDLAVYNDYSQQAYDILMNKSEIASKDPEYYAQMVRVYMGLGFDRKQMQLLLNEASGKEPYYYQTYFNAYFYFLPQWFGNPGDIDRLARFAAERTKAGEGKGVYARVIWYATGCGCYTPNPTEWAEMKQAMPDVMKSYPSDWNAEGFARLSCQMQDKEDTTRYFKLVKSDSALQWPSKIMHDACRSMAGLPPAGAIR